MDTTKTDDQYSWNKGDWCFFEYQLAQVNGVSQDGRVTDVNIGHITVGSHDLRPKMFRMDISGKLVSMDYEARYDELRGASNGLNINFPDIHRWFVDEWVKCMNHRKNSEEVIKSYDRLSSFVAKTLNAISSLRNIDVMGVRLLR